MVVVVVICFHPSHKLRMAKRVISLPGERRYAIPARFVVAGTIVICPAGVIHCHSATSRTVYPVLKVGTGPDILRSRDFGGVYPAERGLNMRSRHALSSSGQWSFNSHSAI